MCPRRRRTARKSEPNRQKISSCPIVGDFSFLQLDWQTKAAPQGIYPRSLTRRMAWKYDSKSASTQDGGKATPQEILDLIIGRYTSKIGSSKARTQFLGERKRPRPQRGGAENSGEKVFNSYYGSECDRHCRSDLTKRDPIHMLAC